MFFEELDKKGLSDDLCQHCRKYIISEMSFKSGWLCEGAFCDVAEESYLTCDKNGINFYRTLKIKNLSNI